MTKQEMHAQFGPRLVCPLPGPKARAAVAADDRLISPSYTRSYPLVAKRGHGIRVEDVDGNEFLDFAAGIAVTSTGHCHPEVVAAIQKQAAELIHISGTDFYNEPLTDLAERLSAVAPMPCVSTSADCPSSPRHRFTINSSSPSKASSMNMSSQPAFSARASSRPSIR